jgi:small-conductance mechanosensitive channel
MTIPDHNAYMDVHEAFNLEIFRRLAPEGIEFAFPTQTLHGELLNLRRRLVLFEEKKLDPSAHHLVDS